MTSYHEFLSEKVTAAPSRGFQIAPAEVHPTLFPFQRDIVVWAIRKGASAVFAKMGLGKTFMQIEWARIVAERTGGKILIACPLGVTKQTINEASKLGVPVRYVRSQAEADAAPEALVISNYDMVIKGVFNPDRFTGIVLDESSKLKAFTSKTKRYLIEAFQRTPYKLACSATPSPNDTKELGNHAEFLDIMSSGEMLTRWFIRDSMNANEMRLKGHAIKDFWRWVTSWAVCINKPSDLDPEYSDEGYLLPDLDIHYELVEVPLDRLIADSADKKTNQLSMLPSINNSATTMFAEKRATLADRIARVAEIVRAHPDEPILIWHLTDAERDVIAREIPEALIVTGSQSMEEKTDRLEQFSDGRARIMATKPSIAGHGLNWQHCSRVIFSSMSHKFEEFWQAIGRSHRYGQKNEVHVHLVYAETEENIIRSIHDKWRKHNEMSEQMVKTMKESGLENDIKHQMQIDIERREMRTDRYHAVNCDAVEEIKALPDNHVHLSVSSWPFSDQYMYSANVRDFGNCDNDEDFFRQLDFLIPELLRVTVPGRVAVVHAKDRIVYGTKNSHGNMYIEPFSDKCIQAMVRHGWLYLGRITISTDVVRENTHTHRLTQTEMRKGGERMGIGMPEYGLIFRKLPTAGNGTMSDEPVTNTPEEYSLARWQIDANSHWRSSGDRLIYPWERDGYDYDDHIQHLEDLDEQGRLSRSSMSEPIPSDNPLVWWDIRRQDVLNGKVARANGDEKHICPLQLDFIRRCIERWSNKGDRVLDYFAGIMSVPVVAIETGRYGIGFELKPEYYDIGARYCHERAYEKELPTLFSMDEECETCEVEEIEEKKNLSA